MLAAPFFLLIFAILETCLSFGAQQVMSNAMDDVARDIRTGQAKNLTSDQLKTNICAKLSMIASDCKNNIEVDLRSYTSFKDAAKDNYINNNGTVKISKNGSPEDLKVSPGGAMTINTMRVFYKWPVITDRMRTYMANAGTNKTLLFSTITWQNEPYDE